MHPDALDVLAEKEGMVVYVVGGIGLKVTEARNLFTIFGD